jgi:Immunity protein 50
MEPKASWLDYVQNPKAASSLYDVPLGLQRVWLHSVYLQEAGWPCSVILVTSELPRRPPQRWGDFNTVHIELGMVDISDLEIVGWPWERIVDVAIGRSESAIAFTATGTGVRLQLRCAGMNICSIRGVLVEKEWLFKFALDGNVAK